jgi:hypothetical protein
MKTFVLLTVGFKQPTPEIMKAWMEWFGSIKESIVKQVGLGQGKDVTSDGVANLAQDKNALTGYLVIKAASMDEAVAIAQRCPMITRTKVYEVMEH